MNTGASQEQNTYFTDQGIKSRRSPSRIQVVECGYGLRNELRMCLCLTAKAFILFGKAHDIVLWLLFLANATFEQTLFPLGV